VWRVFVRKFALENEEQQLLMQWDADISDLVGVLRYIGIHPHT